VIAGSDAESIPGGFVSGNFFGGLGVPPAAGRLIGEENDRKGAPPTVMLGYANWQRCFNGETGIIGKSILINNLRFTVEGVCAPDFFGVDPQISPAFFLPIHAIPLFASNSANEERSRFFDNQFYWIEMMARRRPGVGPEQAQAALRTHFRTFAAGTATKPKDWEVLPELTLEPGDGGLAPCAGNIPNRSMRR
jgi:hypothetical protein